MLRASICYTTKHLSMIQKYLLRATLLILSAVLAGCSIHRPLSVQTIYANRVDLASAYVGTPDPALQYPLEGEKLLIRWHLPANHYSYPLTLVLKIRYRNHTSSQHFYTIPARFGYFTHLLSAEECRERIGILAFQAKLYSGDYCIATAEHQLWSELIAISDE